jgi:hypothetical protein
MEVEGTLSLVVKSGTTTNVGTIAHVGQASGKSWGVALNRKGEVALTLRAGRGPDTLALLTPVPAR